jgi:hypothetical protein
MPWVSPAPLSLFPLLYHLVQVFSWFCVILSMFISKSFFFFFRANKKILLQSGKGIPKSLWWKIEAWSISFWGGVGGGGQGCFHYVIFWGRIRRTCFPAKICLFYEIRKLKEEEEWKEK